MTTPNTETPLIDRERRLKNLFAHQRRLADAIMDITWQTGIGSADAARLRDFARDLMDITIAIEEESA